MAGGHRRRARRPLPRERDRDRRRRALRRRGRLHRRGDAARRGGRRPLRRLRPACCRRRRSTLANALEVEHVVQAARARARRRRPAQRPARDRRRRRSTCSRRTRARRARCRSRARRSASTSSTPPAGSPPGATLRDLEPARGAAADAGQRQGRGAAVRALPRRRPGARARDALDRRGDGERRRPADRVREGRARRGPAAADRAARRSSPSATRDKPAIVAGRGGARRARLRARRDRRHGARRSRAAGLEVDEVAKVADADGRATVVDLVRARPLRPRRQHAAGLRRARRRLPDPRGGARRARPVHHDDLRRRAPPSHAIANARAEIALSLQERIEHRDASGMRRERCSVVGGRAGRPVHAAARRARRRSSRACPGQFFMLEAPGRRAAAADERSASRRAGELGVPDRPDRPGDAGALRARAAATRSHVLGPLGNGFDLDVERPLLVGGGIGIAPLPVPLASRSGGPPALLGFRSERHAEAAALVPSAEVVRRADARHRAAARRAGRRARVRARADARGACARSCPDAQLAWEAPMACGYGACYGCVVEIDGELQAPLRRGPVLGRCVPPQRLRLPRRADRARGRARARRVRDEDDHAAAARGQPAGADRRDRARDAELDRARRTPASSASSPRRCRALRRARRAALGLRRRLLGRRLRRDLRAPRRATDVDGDRAQPLVPERRRGARDAPPRSSPPAARRRDSRSTRSSRPPPGTSPSRRGRSRPPAPTGSRS